jgi:glycosyltransferase involved in cell wall biosynthesis
MRVLIRQFLNANHSWAHVGRGIATALIEQKHDVDLFSTDGGNNIPDNLKSHLVGYSQDNKLTFGKLPDNHYDMVISYTALKNMQPYMSHAPKNRFGIWCYEFAGKNALPDGFAKCNRFCDKLLPPSNFAKQVFLDSGIPEKAMTVIPHGVDFDQIKSAEPFKLKTKKSTKIMVQPLGQIHRRKNIDGLLDMYGKAFTKSDDVCLILKIQEKTPTQPFELSFKDLYNNFHAKYKNHAEVEIIKEYIPNIYSLYKSCDIVFTASNTEGFGMCALEANALGLINIAPRYGGFLDFLNNDNSLLIDGKEFFVPANYLYWQGKLGTKAFKPDLDDGVMKLRFAVSNKDELLKRYRSNIQETEKNYNWLTITDKILKLAV